MDASMFVDFVIRKAEQREQRTGQALFNQLPMWAAQVVGGSLFDPFHRELSRQELLDWCDNHLIFGEDCAELLAVFVNDKILSDRGVNPQ